MDNSAIQAEAHKILLEPDFQQAANQEPVFDFWKWLREFLNFKSPFELHGDPIPWQLLGIGLKAILVLLVAFAALYTIRWLIQKFARAEKRGTLHTVTQQQREAAQVMYTRQAQAALKAKDYRLAIHYLFLAAVSQVIEDARFHASEYMTNREIAGATDFSAFADAGQLSRLFQEMVFFDEPLWFGQGIVSEQDYQRFHQFYGQFAASLQRIGLRGRHA